MVSLIPLLEYFNSREIAFLFWLFVFIVWLLFQEKIRQSVKGVLKLFFSRKIFSITLLTVFYNCLFILLLSNIGYWKIWLLKDSIFWILGVALIQLINANNAQKERNFFKDILLNNLKLIIIFEFLVNLYTFKFWIELLVFPLYVMIIAIYAFSETNKEYEPAKKLTENILAIIGLFFFVFVSIKTYQNFPSISTFDNFRAIVLPVILTVGYLPFLYFAALFMSYEILFVRIKMQLKKEKQIVKVAKRKIICLCNINLRKLNRFSEKFLPALFKLEDKTKVVDIIK